ncbi:hypothetical protein DMN91_008850 [Ooceraea biroi]|uniref:Reverse transcriptase domain-containing protein n=1 Tax=Ooceraea biroi TaxID=2015173 RepID=A0A3L8DEB9_OOCBI|nr:hypothetical protein DMN91_008850 [Ooceraea biroi]
MGKHSRSKSRRRDHPYESKLDKLLEVLTQSSPLQERRREIHDHHSNLSPDVIPQSFSPERPDIEAISDSPTEVVETSGTTQGNYTLLGLRTSTTILQGGEPELPHIPENSSTAPVPVDPAHDVDAFKMDLMGTNLDSAATGPSVHDLITKTWSAIIISGLPKETTLALCKKYPVPQNLSFAKAPTLNTEVKQVMPSTSVKRDDYQVITQGMVAAAITAQAHLVSELLKPEEQWDGKRIFEWASDTGRLLSHIQHHVSRNRRALITPMLTPSARNALETSPIDTQLFGEQYLNKMKEATAANKLMKGLTTLPPPASKPVSSRGKGCAATDETPIEVSHEELSIPPLEVGTAGRLARFVDAWSRITNDKRILTAILGYKLPFSQIPPSRPYLREPQLSTSERSLCAAEIDRLLTKGAIQRVDFVPDQYLSSYFLIDKASGGKQFILNLKPLNEYIFAPHFKLKNLTTATRLLSPGSFMASIDLEDSYFLVPVHVTTRKYLRFSFQEEIFEFSALPFDDFLLFGDTFQDCAANVNATLQLLAHLGFLINPQKCELVPSRRRKYLDASPSGWGASMGRKQTHGWWSDQDRDEHINFLELKAVEYALRSFVDNLHSRDILLRVDNTTAIAYINRGGSLRFPKLSALAKSIWQWSERESRIVSVETEWEITSRSFDRGLEHFDPFDIDLFASYINAKCQTFVSWFPDPFATAIDAFTLDWSEFYFYTFPPFVLITKVLRKIVNDGAVPRSQHPTWHNIPLIAGRLSGKLFAEKDFRRSR